MNSSCYFKSAPPNNCEIIDDLSKINYSLKTYKKNGLSLQQIINHFEK